MEYTRRYIEPNEMFPSVMPYSEVCMHMKIAGKIMWCKWDGNRSVQLYRVECHGNGYNADDKFVPFSAPILLGEAGLYTDESGVYQVIGGAL